MFPSSLTSYSMGFLSRVVVFSCHYGSIKSCKSRHTRLWIHHYFPNPKSYSQFIWLQNELEKQIQLYSSSIGIVLQRLCTCVRKENLINYCRYSLIASCIPLNEYEFIKQHTLLSPSSSDYKFTPVYVGKCHDIICSSLPSFPCFPCFDPML